ncbi:AAA family ATPase [Clostridium manihotivorum]|uniref:Magnesium chelatase n=1 Tax=Clostridium manihotivorum TaxID=2320868 RepID=A0A3R5TIZ7_9CLOT|nr:MoxR family ATPase [Clostridium manihotivorum]QAA34598.1 magnesium chelatase [Clostridium manihotivorum]
MREREIISKVLDNLNKVIIGKQSEINNILKGVIANGHILIEDVPGVGKTTLVKALAKTIDLTYSRIQFTPDLLPSDITGISIYNQKNMEFEFKEGPIFSNIVLADEINRTSPKTQSALLEVMEENQVSEGGQTHRLKSPFIVMATQNPIDYDGTFRLPEAQLDRFIIKVSLGYPSSEAEVDILEKYREKSPLEDLSNVVTAEDILYLQDAVKKVKVATAVNEYIVRIANKTRESNYISLGVSTRAILSLQKVAQASALLNGRNYVIPEDVKENAALVLSHRIIMSSTGKANGYGERETIEDILRMVEAPRVTFNG